jgi:hypothetical protein
MEPVSRKVRPFVHSRPVVECAQCGTHIFAPDWSEYLEDRRVRHLWVCEACDYQFETIVSFAAAS